MSEAVRFKPEIGQWYGWSALSLLYFYSFAGLYVSGIFLILAWVLIPLLLKQVFIVTIADGAIEGCNGNIGEWTALKLRTTIPVQAIDIERSKLTPYRVWSKDGKVIHLPASHASRIMRLLAGDSFQWEPRRLVGLWRKDIACAATLLALILTPHFNSIVWRTFCLVIAVGAFGFWAARKWGLWLLKLGLPTLILSHPILCFMFLNAEPQTPDASSHPLIRIWLLKTLLLLCPLGFAGYALYSLKGIRILEDS